MLSLVCLFQSIYFGCTEKLILISTHRCPPVGSGPAPCVLRIGHRLSVVGVDAACLPAMMFPGVPLFVELDTCEFLCCNAVRPDFLVLAVHPHRDAPITMMITIAKPDPAFGGLAVDRMAAIQGNAVGEQPVGEVEVFHSSSSSSASSASLSRRFLVVPWNGFSPRRNGHKGHTFTVHSRTSDSCPFEQVTHMLLMALFGFLTRA